MTARTYTASGPGTWEQEPMHWPRMGIAGEPITR